MVSIVIPAASRRAELELPASGVEMKRTGLLRVKLTACPKAQAGL